MMDYPEFTTEKYIALINFDDDLSNIEKLDFNGIKLLSFKTTIQLVTDWRANQFNIVAIISKSEILGNYGLNIVEILENESMPSIPVFLIITHFNDNLRTIAINGKIAEVFVVPVDYKDIQLRVNFIISNWENLQNPYVRKDNVPYKTPIGKRVFDIVFSSAALLFLSPLLLLVYLLIKLESRGPAFYYSYRVGTGYKIFKFYKFRSMYINADQRLQDLKHLNQYDDSDNKTISTYEAKESFCDDCIQYQKCQFPIFGDGLATCEKTYASNAAEGSAFIKIKDDPRITKVGKFIRNTSIDELPQLVNVLIGNMSVVGNRPLPLYEAEKLTTDKYTLRFRAPAGITGLWQVEKRGKGGMSEEERLMLDNSYAINHSFRNDLRVILKTIPALLQTENV
jgi:lipopolysaccharide/colanic/teichoic acid biosynthesis glycosyltransferase